MYAPRHVGTVGNPIQAIKDGVTVGKIVMVVIGIVLILVGTIWFFQGINILPGSFMTGVSFWAFAGAGSFIVGLILLLAGIRKRAKS